MVENNCGKDVVPHLLNTDTGPSPGPEAAAAPAFDAFFGISPGSSRGLTGFGVAGVGVGAALTGLELGAGVVAALTGFGVDGLGVGGADGFALDGAESALRFVTTGVAADGGASFPKNQQPH